MSSTSKGSLPSRQELSQALSSFSLRQKILMSALALVGFVCLLIAVWRINNHFLIQVAVPGGSLTEGIVGFPSHANPILAVTDADRDVSALVYSGLMKINEEGKPTPDLAESYTVSQNGLVYDFILKKDLTWQDGKSLTADDIEFTIAKAQDPNIKSPHRAAWEGIKVEKISDKEIRFTLKKPYASFLENATMGILPKHIWSDIKTDAFLFSDYNIKGIGSGPYQVTKVSRDTAGLPKYYDLKPFNNYALGTAKISTITLRFYNNDEEIAAGFARGEIESFSSVPADTAEKLKKEGATVRQILLPRSFAVFFNRNQPVLADKNVRKALALCTDKTALVKDILKDSGVVLNNPIPAGSLGFIEDSNSNSTTTDFASAEKLLINNGWKKDGDGVWAKYDKKTKKTTRLEFTLDTSNTPELKATAEALALQWQKFGASVQVKVYDLSDLDQNLIRPRKFEALLFGEIIGRDPDLYPFWHSSQRLAPGLNITQYANSITDKLLEDVRQSNDAKVRATKNQKFQTELAKDTPAIFLYSPYFLYVLPNKVQGAKFPSLLVPSERFATIQNWYINQDKVWKFFTTSH
jgi:peptide/nickel transport system substrate-binding protein